MPELKLTADYLKTKADELKHCQKEQENIISTVTALLEEEIFNGFGRSMALEAFAASFREKKPVCERLSEDIGVLSQFFERYAGILADKEAIDADPDKKAAWEL